MRIGIHHVSIVSALAAFFLTYSVQVIQLPDFACGLGRFVDCNCDGSFEVTENHSLESAWGRNQPPRLYTQGLEVTQYSLLRFSIVMKTVEQQGLQAIQRSRELLIGECTALPNHLRGILLEFGVAIPQGFASLMKALPEILEDGDNELPDLYRPTLHRMHTRLVELREDIEAMTKEVGQLVKQHPVCKRLTAIEGIGPIGALSLYAVMGSGKAFSKSREFSAYLGLTPRQYSSGGKTNIVGISKKVGNHRLRSILIQGARAYVYRMKEPRSLKDRWLKDLIERAGPNRAAVALANKNVRTAWAMATQGTDYQRRLQLEMAAQNVLQTETCIR